MDHRQNCCLCKAKPKWYSPKDITVNLNIEYVRRNGESIVAGGDDLQNKENIYLNLIHNQGFMSKFPNNICTFERIVTVNLRNNEITEIGNISCLALLDVLDLS